ncbi:MAG: hypothetical protein HY433_01000 [Candidatus Liptonbacteria bacterium]|nr:hypothetical protein [Candidatus Liptonbacteria bacterium]
MAHGKKNGGMTLDKLALMMGRGFNATDKKFDSINKRFDSVDARLAVLEVDARETKKRLDKIEESIAGLANTLDAFLKRLTACRYRYSQVM